MARRLRLGYSRYLRRRYVALNSFVLEAPDYVEHFNAPQMRQHVDMDIFK
jgi:hypothetical protein